MIRWLMFFVSDPPANVALPNDARASLAAEVLRLRVHKTNAFSGKALSCALGLLAEDDRMRGFIR